MINICPLCGKGKYQHGSGLYDFYSCGHAHEKPQKYGEKGKMIYYPSPYLASRRGKI